MNRTDSAGHLVWAMVNRLNETGQSTALAAIHETGLTLPQTVVLHILRRGPSRISALADHLQMSMSATSTLVQRLFEDQLISRDEDPDDRRQKRVELTRKGINVIDRIDRERGDGVARGLAKLPQWLRDELVDVCGRVIEHLKEQG
jgi:DNA-binding MarR family transcriptional regulator